MRTVAPHTPSLEWNRRKRGAWHDECAQSAPHSADDGTRHCEGTMAVTDSRTTGPGGCALRPWVGLLLFSLLLGLSPAAAYAQRDLAREAERAVEWLLGFPSWTVEAYGGLANHGRFLLQTVAVEDFFPPGVGDDIVFQRALTAKNSFSFGGAAGFTVLPRTTIRLGFNRAASELEYNDDTGTGSSIFDADDVGDLSSNTLSLEVLRFFLPERIKFTPYAGLGVALTWWHLDEDRAFFAEEDSHTRWGGVGTFGLQYRFSSAWAVRAEAATFSVGNPFTGEESFVTTSGFTIDEPTRVRQTNFRLVVAYTFGRPRRP